MCPRCYALAIPGWNCKTRLRRRGKAKISAREKDQGETSHNSLVSFQKLLRSCRTVVFTQISMQIHSCPSCSHTWTAPAISKLTRQEQKSAQVKIERQKKRKREEQKHNQHQQFNAALKVRNPPYFNLKTPAVTDPCSSFVTIARPKSIPSFTIWPLELLLQPTIRLRRGTGEEGAVAVVAGGSNQPRVATKASRQVGMQGPVLLRFRLAAARPVQTRPRFHSPGEAGLQAKPLHFRSRVPWVARRWRPPSPI
jgi:hypothetical protein